ncbi:hypothetical protein SDRG_07015 [Saprolegnia diclina VS20]|uniref:CAAX prenyl protease n=1 Tax=Saprolegnia diclina (strain VS20) TaxID=1156394 RepID=T0QBL9_SAPDV|nr:hypothetical protein SDRG_07015 [Saprolegnia diclina VS20]EQC35304.1 hypothetical protein SDRG_07015 [Saprolegnia diclina VS20]|eukprot:XP_008611054.1 hypothetical protein SDRG_07015 [Saprolegnia diclina VS20]
MLAPWFCEEGWAPSPVPYLEGTLVFVAAVYAFETYLDYRQHAKLHETSLPPALASAIAHIDDVSNEKEPSLLVQTQAKFEKSRLYSLDKSRFGFVTGAIHELEGVLLLLGGYLPFMWVLSGRLVGFYGEIPQSLLFAVLTSCKDVIFNLPFELYSVFVLEERHGFNKQTLRLFCTDKLQGLALSALLGLPLLAALLALIQWGGDGFVFYVWLLTFSFTLLLLTIYPVLIMPLFNTFTPLPDGPLRHRIEALAATLHFPLTQLFVCDGSKRSSHSNAYMYGFFHSKRIVLFDTLLTQANDNEIVAILGHELGHWKLWHTLQGFAFQQVYVIALFYVFGRCMHDVALFRSFGFGATTPALPVMIGLTLFAQTLWAPVDKVLSFLLTYNTRQNEFAADAFAVQLGHADALQSGLTKISLENLANMNPDPMYSAYHYSHPPLLERLCAIGITKHKTL